MSADTPTVPARAFGHARVEAVRGDITREPTDAIVNAANSGLLGGGGVDGAIRRAGGPAIIDACRAIRAQRGSLPTGEAVLTTGGRLPARYVIHTVGPVWVDGERGEADLLARCYTNSLKLAVEHSLRSIAFPSISTGAYGYPIEEAAPIAVEAVREGVARAPSLVLVRFVLFSPADLETYERALSGTSPQR